MFQNLSAKKLILILTICTPIFTPLLSRAHNVDLFASPQIKEVVAEPFSPFAQQSKYSTPEQLIALSPRGTPPVRRLLKRYSNMLIQQNLKPKMANR